MNTPNNLKYTSQDEWLKVDGDVATIGITDYAQDQLGEITFVDINPDTVGETLGKEESFGAVEAVKAVAEVYMPVSGEIIEVNNELDGSPALVNEDPYGAGWLIKVKMSNLSEVDTLLDAEAYDALPKNTH